MLVVPDLTYGRVDPICKQLRAMLVEGSTLEAAPALDTGTDGLEHIDLLELQRRVARRTCSNSRALARML